MIPMTSVKSKGNNEIPLLKLIVANLLKYCKAGSLTGAVTSQIVTEVCEGEFKLVGNQL
jgi:hypothetical protein